MRVRRGSLEGVGAGDREERSRGIVLLSRYVLGYTQRRALQQGRLGRVLGRGEGGGVTGGVKEGWAGLVSDRPFWLLGWASLSGPAVVAPVLW